MLNDIKKDAEQRMKGAVDALGDDLLRIRTGRANPALVEDVKVEYYGAPTPLQQLASISIPEPRSILIRPFDPSTLKEIERGILASDVGMTPNNDGKVVRLNLPMLTEERRKELVKTVKSRSEDARIAVRNVRRDLIRDLRDYENEKMISEDEQKRGEDELQKATDRFTGLIDKACEKKEAEVLEV
ncbi:MAG: ribosome recycling factor [Anaerolineae bacterium]|nr:ribosome recycling factor [Anaerolineae bacterium]MBT7073955.1 ribosome recycling factor [Anaerolineae bacterium]MBT7782475.1 ribosome recycling factor [Anaerolineae bacterium]